MQLRFADVLLCAVEPQLARLDAALDGSAAGPRPRAWRSSPSACPRTRRRRTRPMRARFPQIGADDTVILWWGNVWRWSTRDRAARVRPAGRRSPACASSSPLAAIRAATGRCSSTAAGPRARRRARAAGPRVLPRRVGHPGRAPPVPARGRRRADPCARHGRDPGRRARALHGLRVGRAAVRARRRRPPRRPLRRGRLRLDRAQRRPRGRGRRARTLIDDPEERERRRAASRPLADEFRWSATVQPLVEALGAGRRAPAHLGRRAALARDLGEYYVRKALLAATPAAPSQSRGGLIRGQDRRAHGAERPDGPCRGPGGLSSSRRPPRAPRRWSEAAQCRAAPRATRRRGQSSRTETSTWPSSSPRRA